MFKRHCKYLLLCVTIAVAFLGCKKEVKNTETVVPLTQSPQINTPAPTVSSEPEATATAEVSQVTAMFFPDLTPVPMLYAAIEVTNTGNRPVCVSNISVTFNTGAYKVDGEFTPMLYKDDIILPGKTAGFALWQKYDKEPELRADAKIKVSAKLKVEQADSERHSRELEPSNVRLIGNYPGFSTLTGSVRNPSKESAFSLSLFYASFYDEEDHLLCVWHFSENVAIAAEESRNFVSHLKELPISGLSSKVKRIDARCLGID